MKGQTMHIQINTDRSIHGHDTYLAKVHDRIEGALERFSPQITRVEVHLTDQNGTKAGTDDKRCVIEVRPEHHQPVAVTHQASTAEEAVDGAVSKIVSVMEKLSDKQQDRTRSADMLVSHPTTEE
jgi:ribosome-associated translation inhibitor RaiA